jgi:hypothetical protein
MAQERLFPHFSCVIDLAPDLYLDLGAQREALQTSVHIC